MGNQQKGRKQREAEEQPHVLLVEKQPAEHLRHAQEKNYSRNGNRQQSSFGGPCQRSLQFPGANAFFDIDQ
jgi:hypothetical protein